jgi:hypothetical protein
MSNQYHLPKTRKAKIEFLKKLAAAQTAAQKKKLLYSLKEGENRITMWREDGANHMVQYGPHEPYRRVSNEEYDEEMDALDQDTIEITLNLS